MWRAGVTAIPPTSLESGLYYLVVDSSEQEIRRGNGLYRLYLGHNRWLGTPVQSSSFHRRMPSPLP